VIVRLPNTALPGQEKQHLSWAKKWLEKQVISRPSTLEHFKTRKYEDGDALITTKKTYSLQVSKEFRKTAEAICIENKILLKIPIDVTPQSKSKLAHTLIGRILAQDNINWVEERVRWFNSHYFQGKIKSVRLKNNKTNWGSCSSSGNINISIRLLFAPEDVQDYVLIHELAHLEELNHTSKFWKIVEGIMPDYKQKERWLKENNHHCNF